MESTCELRIFEGQCLRVLLREVKSNSGRVNGGYHFTVPKLLTE